MNASKPENARAAMIANMIPWKQIQNNLFTEYYTIYLYMYIIIFAEQRNLNRNYAMYSTTQSRPENFCVQ